MKTLNQPLRLELSALLAVLACIPMCRAVSVSLEEMSEASQWVAAKFKGLPQGMFYWAEGIPSLRLGVQAM